MVQNGNLEINRSQIARLLFHGDTFDVHVGMVPQSHTRLHEHHILVHGQKHLGQCFTKYLHTNIEKYFYFQKKFECTGI